jgi:NADH:ubiquinone oxidoreductase subunit 6 (subunit J)
MISFETIQHGVSALAIRFGVHTSGLANLVVGATSLTVAANCTDAFVTTLESGINMIIQILMALGIAIAVIGIIVGLMRATAWGSEQRIATSNKAITCAVIGLVIVILGVTLGAQIPSWFGNAGGSCTNQIK